MLRASSSTGLDNYRTYFSTPALFRSIKSSLLIVLLSTLITVSLAFGFAYALTRLIHLLITRKVVRKTQAWRRQ